MKYKYECLWYRDPELNDTVTKEFSTKKAALNFYEKHKNDPDKFGWWVTKRDEDWYAVEDLIW